MGDSLQEVNSILQKIGAALGPVQAVASVFDPALAAIVSVVNPVLTALEQALLDADTAIRGVAVSSGVTPTTPSPTPVLTAPGANPAATVATTSS
jgi:hypothetical protein